MQGDGTAGMNDSERLRILELLEQGKITAAEADELLSALEHRAREGRGWRGRWGGGEPGGDRPRWFRIRVTDRATGKTRANVTVPIGVVGFGIGFARKMRMTGPHGRPIDDIIEAVRTGRRGTVFDVTGHDGERVEIIIE
jgi:DNA-binding transcriptional ArsR family regulator